jgi:hypothetical protein
VLPSSGHGARATGLPTTMVMSATQALQNTHTTQRPPSLFDLSVILLLFGEAVRKVKAGKRRASWEAEDGKGAGRDPRPPPPSPVFWGHSCRAAAPGWWRRGACAGTCCRSQTQPCAVLLLQARAKRARSCQCESVACVCPSSGDHSSHSDCKGHHHLGLVLVPSRRAPDHLRRRQPAAAARRRLLVCHRLLPLLPRGRCLGGGGGRCAAALRLDLCHCFGEDALALLLGGGVEDVLHDAQHGLAGARVAQHLDSAQLGPLWTCWGGEGPGGAARRVAAPRLTHLHCSNGWLWLPQYYPQAPQHPVPPTPQPSSRKSPSPWWLSPPPRASLPAQRSAAPARRRRRPPVTAPRSPRGGRRRRRPPHRQRTAWRSARASVRCPGPRCARRSRQPPAAAPPPPAQRGRPRPRRCYRGAPAGAVQARPPRPRCECRQSCTGRGALRARSRARRSRRSAGQSRP